jgi:hypothetical protein
VWDSAFTIIRQLFEGLSFDRKITDDLRNLLGGLLLRSTGHAELVQCLSKSSFVVKKETR